MRVSGASWQEGALGGGWCWGGGGRGGLRACLVGAGPRATDMGWSPVRAQEVTSRRPREGSRSVM